MTKEEAKTIIRLKQNIRAEQGDTFQVVLKNGKKLSMTYKEKGITKWGNCVIN